MKASTYITSLGFTGGITRIAKLTGWDRRTLYRYYHEELDRFEIIVLGCVSKGEKE